MPEGAAGAGWGCGACGVGRCSVVHILGPDTCQCGSWVGAGAAFSAACPPRGGRSRRVASLPPLVGRPQRLTEVLAPVL
jgi:hypothetical protein